MNDATALFNLNSGPDRQRCMFEQVDSTILAAQSKQCRRETIRVDSNTATFLSPSDSKVRLGPRKIWTIFLFFQVWILSINMPRTILLPVMHIIRFSKDLTMNITTNAVPIVSEVTFRSSMGGHA